MRTRMMFMSAVVVCGLSACPLSVVQDNGDVAKQRINASQEVAKQRINAPTLLAKQRINRPASIG